MVERSVTDLRIRRRFIYCINTQLVPSPLKDRELLFPTVVDPPLISRLPAVLNVCELEVEINVTLPAELFAAVMVEIVVGAPDKYKVAFVDARIAAGTVIVDAAAIVGQVLPMPDTESVIMLVVEPLKLKLFAIVELFLDLAPVRSTVAEASETLTFTP